MNFRHYSYVIDCCFTQFISFPEEPDQGFFIRTRLLDEIKNFGKTPAVVLKQYEYMTTNEWLYQIDCKLTQYCWPAQEPDEGYFIRTRLLDEIKNFGKTPAIVLEQFEYMTTNDWLCQIDCKLTQYCWPAQEPDEGHYIRQALVHEIESEFKQRLNRRASFSSVIKQLSYHPKFMNQRIQKFDDIEDFFESMGC